MKWIVIILLCSACLGCAGGSINPILLTSSFDRAFANNLLMPGNNKIIGSALIRQQGGGIVTCAGCEVHLVPATDYAKERMKYYLGSTNYLKGGYSKINIYFKPDEPEYHTLRLKTIGDAQGSFEFDKIADGDYYIITTISWGTDILFKQGGSIIKYIEISKGETKKVVLSQ